MKWIKNKAMLEWPAPVYDSSILCGLPDEIEQDTKPYPSRDWYLPKEE